MRLGVKSGGEKRQEKGMEWSSEEKQGQLMTWIYLI